MDILLLGRTLHLIDHVIKKLHITFCFSSPLCRTICPSYVVKAVEAAVEAGVKFHKGLVEVVPHQIIYLIIYLSLP